MGDGLTGEATARRARPAPGRVTQIRAAFPGWFRASWTAAAVLVGVGLVRVLGAVAPGVASQNTIATAGFLLLVFAPLAALAPLVASSYIATDEGLCRERRARVVWSVAWRDIVAVTPGFSVELTRIRLRDGRALTLLRAMPGYREILNVMRGRVSVSPEVEDVARTSSALALVWLLGLLVAAYVVAGLFTSPPGE